MYHVVNSQIKTKTKTKTKAKTKAKAKAKARNNKDKARYDTGKDMDKWTNTGIKHGVNVRI
jgi:hypothetical protein